MRAIPHAGQERQIVAVHATVDFSLQNPAVAATYALLMGAAVAQSWGNAEKL